MDVVALIGIGVAVFWSMQGSSSPSPAGQRGCRSETNHCVRFSVFVLRCNLVCVKCEVYVLCTQRLFVYVLFVCMSVWLYTLLCVSCLLLLFVCVFSLCVCVHVHSSVCLVCRTITCVLLASVCVSDYTFFCVCLVCVQCVSILKCFLL